MINNKICYYCVIIGAVVGSGEFGFVGMFGDGRGDFGIGRWGGDLGDGVEGMGDFDWDLYWGFFVGIFCGVWVKQIIRILGFQTASGCKIPRILCNNIR